SMFFTMDLALGWDVFNLFPKEKYNLVGGWILNSQHMYTGFVRLLYPYLCGLLIARILPGRITAENPSGSPLHLKNAFWWCGLAIIVILAMPCIGGKVGVADGLYQCIAVWFLFPLIVLIGAGSVIKGPKTAKLCKFLGDISYPLYIVHYPVIMMQFPWVRRNPDAPLWMHIGIFIAGYVISLMLAYGALKLFDEPVRKWLKQHWLK
ncbi:MAG: acyltransferase, partial [Spirochaetales bacterium]|nr:acyltransferase [Spirochaetales bacterium]